MNTELTIRAVALSPWATLLFVAALFIDLLVSRSMQSSSELANLFPDILFVLGMFVFGHLGIAYLGVFFIGLPLHFVLSRLGLKHWGLYLFSGTASGLLLQYVQLAGSDMPIEFREVGYWSYGICAALVSVSFWFIAVHSRKET